MVTCLRRVANARSQLATLEAAAGGPAVDAADVARLEELAAEAEALHKKAKSRFGGGAARDRLTEIEGQERLLLAELGVADLADARARLLSTGDVDATLLEFTRNELRQAEAELAEVLAMDVPDAEAEPAADDAAGDDIDLRDEPTAS